MVPLENLPQALGRCHLIGPVSQFSKGHSIFPSDQQLHDGGEHDKKVDSIVVGPLSHFKVRNSTVGIPC